MTDEQLGISMRSVWNYDIVNDMFLWRADVLYGWVTARRQLAARVSS